MAKFTKEVTIITVLNGYRVKVGCQEVVFDSRKKMLKELNRYLKNPNKLEAEYMPDSPPLGVQQSETQQSETYEIDTDSIDTELEIESVARIRQDVINYLRDIRHGEVDVPYVTFREDALHYLRVTESHPGSQILPNGENNE